MSVIICGDVPLDGCTLSDQRSLKVDAIGDLLGIIPGNREV